MNDPLALGLKFGFLAVLYLFLIWIARSSLRDLVAKGRRGEAQPVRADHHDGSGGSRSLHPRLVVHQAPGHRVGTEVDIGLGVTLGRSAQSDVMLDDPYASSVHARVFPRGESVYLEDMGSTNGTFLNGEVIRAPQRLGSDDVIRIGDTEYQYQE